MWLDICSTAATFNTSKQQRSGISKVLKLQMEVKVLTENGSNIPTHFKGH